MESIQEQQQLSSRIIKTEPIEWKSLKFIQQEGFKDWIDTGDKKLLQSLLKYNFVDPFKVWQDESGQLWCLDGFHRYSDLLKVEQSGIAVPSKLPGTFIECKDKNDAASLVLIYSSIYARISQQGMYDFLQEYSLNYDEIKDAIEIPEFDDIDFEALVRGGGDSSGTEDISRSLSDKFLIPPFSIFDTRQGYWQDRKRKWSALFDSQETREDVELIAKSGQAPAVYALRNKMRESLQREPTWDEIIKEAEKRGMHIYSGASIFDPVLAEVCYRWFCTPGGSVIDPFAGGSVRGIVAALTGCEYTGIDLREDQVKANRKQAAELNVNPKWITGDSGDMLPALKGEFDFIYSCPPYHDLEQYSDDPKDLSNMDYDKFIEVYRSIIFKSLIKLKPNRFACFVVGDIRDKEGKYRNFVSDTIDAFINQPLCDGHTVCLYNEIILVNVAGSLPVRIGRQFAGYRKVGKMHQNVLVFFKGDPQTIKANYPEIEVPDEIQEDNFTTNIPGTEIL